jgi:hypothetical protein
MLIDDNIVLYNYRMAEIKQLHDELQLFIKRIVRIVNDHVRYNVEIKQNIGIGFIEFIDRINIGMRTLHMTDIMKINAKTIELIDRIDKIHNLQKQKHYKIFSALMAIGETKNDKLFETYKYYLNQISELCQIVYKNIKNDVDSNSKYHELKLLAYECQQYMK